MLLADPCDMKVIERGHSFWVANAAIADLRPVRVSADVLGESQRTCVDCDVTDMAVMTNHAGQDRKCQVFSCTSISGQLVQIKENIDAWTHFGNSFISLAMHCGWRRAGTDDRAG